MQRKKEQNNRNRELIGQTPCPRSDGMLVVSYIRALFLFHPRVFLLLSEHDGVSAVVEHATSGTDLPSGRWTRRLVVSTAPA